MVAGLKRRVEVLEKFLVGGCFHVYESSEYCLDNLGLAVMCRR